ncbi:Rho termination factor N-terminal domain-containing protein [Paenibacillus macerans]|uniref:Rho termination factor N-terminal domain-containing protein n=1 Tax=Paenibacillus macerans TaxID=44252 RepID=UPI00203D17F5|nr:Rho termination factor N-terminal domain-containing protein [Paenibacillus macerans]MCM3699199.1 Rho termination factor N-terminal domain-containing protein [Paenibacillus macerans]
MYKITFTGSNTSLTKYGIRFEPGKPQPIDDAELAEKLKQERDFTVEKLALATPAPAAASSDSDGDTEPTLTALKEQAKAAGIKGYSTMNRQELAEALAAQPKADPYANAPTA